MRHSAVTQDDMLAYGFIINAQFTQPSHSIMFKFHGTYKIHSHNTN